MGASISSNSARFQQTFINNVTQNNQQNCTAVQDNNISGNVVIVSGSVVDGSVVGVNAVQIETDASCLMVSSMDQSVTDILTAISQQTNSTDTDIFGDFEITDSSNTFNVKQTVVNNINQINESSCSASLIQNITGNYTYVANSEVQGDVYGVNLNGSDANANCSMSNYMKAATYNQAQASSSQSNSTIGMFSLLIGVIGVILIIMIIGIIIVFSISSNKYLEYQKIKSQAPPKPTQEQELGSLIVETLGKNNIPGILGV